MRVNVDFAKIYYSVLINKDKELVGEEDAVIARNT